MGCQFSKLNFFCDFGVSIRAYSSVVEQSIAVFKMAPLDRPLVRFWLRPLSFFALVGARAPFFYFAWCTFRAMDHMERQLDAAAGGGGDGAAVPTEMVLKLLKA